MGKQQIGGPVATAIIVIVVIVVVGVGLYIVNRPQKLTGVAAERSAAFMKQQETQHANQPASPSTMGGHGYGMPTQGH